MRERIPTNGENATVRLFLRHFLYYLSALPAGLYLSSCGLLQFEPSAVGKAAFLFILLAALGALLTVTKPYLAALSVGKGLFDASLLYRVTQLAKDGEISIWSWNACFFLIAFSLLLFCFAAARASLFSFFMQKRDMKLIFSREFWHFLMENLLLAAPSLLLCFLWPEIYAAF